MRKKTVLTAVTAALSAGLIAFAAAASADDPPSFGSSSGVETTSHSRTVEQDRGGADDPVTHDLGNDHGSGGHGADDVAPPAPPAQVRAPSGGGADDPVTHDVGD